MIAQGNFKIDNTVFTAKTMKQTFESLASEDSGRTDDGVMQISWVLQRIRKIEISMPPMTSLEVSALLDKVQGQIYSMTYFDILTNTEKTKTFYTSNSEGDCYSGVLHNGLWQGVTFNAIEVGGEKKVNGSWIEVS